MSLFRFHLFLCGLCLSVTVIAAFDITRSDNVVAYWGQNSVSNGGGTENTLGFYCGLGSTYNALLLAFMPTFGSSTPTLNFADHTGADCLSTPSDAGCVQIATDIQSCQTAGKIVLLSLGGSGGSYEFTSASQASTFADTIWNTFLGGTTAVRPFGSSILDGIDLDIEGGSPNYYSNFIIQLRTYFTGASKTYYISGAPQCPYPDAWLGTALNAAWFDFVNIQFYNNYCRVSTPSQFNFAQWVNWANTDAVNPNVRLFVGAAGSSYSANAGSYVNASALTTLLKSVQSTASSAARFGGIMVWDVGTSYANSNYAAVVKAGLLPFGSSSSTAPSSSGSSTSASSASTVSSFSTIYQCLFVLVLTTMASFVPQLMAEI